LLAVVRRMAGGDRHVWFTPACTGRSEYGIQYLLLSYLFDDLDIAGWNGNAILLIIQPDGGCADGIFV